jgi:hypothetical protein
MATDTQAVTAADLMRSRADHVAAWLRQRLFERPEGWLQSELIRRAWRDDIDLLAWWDAPAVQATKIKGVNREAWPGASMLFFVIDPEAKDQ